MNYLLLFMVSAAIAADVEFITPSLRMDRPVNGSSARGRLSSENFTESKQGVSFAGYWVLLQYDFNIFRLSEEARVTVSFDVAGVGDVKWGIISEA